MKISRDSFIQKLKQVGKLTKEKVSLNADEDVRLRFFYENFMRSNNSDSEIVKENENLNETQVL